jgi:Mn2+/Fe2+ NRAMP family transporter
VAWFIIVACAGTLYAHGVRNISSAADAAAAMKPFAERYAPILFAAGLFNASFFAASILPLSTTYAVCEGLGFESGVNRSFRQAPFFYWLYTLLIVAGGLTVILLKPDQQVPITILSQVLDGVLLPFVLYFMLKLTNNKELMGKYTNSRGFNVIAWATSIVVLALTAVGTWQTVASVWH